MTGPVAWIRFCGDGCVEGPILDSVIEEVQRKSGAWTPLYAAPQPAPAIDLSSIDPEWIKYAALMLRQDSDATDERCAVELDRLLALIDGKAVPRPLIARPLAEWHEDDGPVMWWAWCGHEWAGEPAWCGQPSDSDWPGYHTHWTPHPAMPLQPTKGEGE